MVKLMQLKNKQLIITIPKRIAEAKRLKKGDDMDFLINDVGQMILKKRE